MKPPGYQYTTKVYFINATKVEKTNILAKVNTRRYFKEIFERDLRQDPVIDAIRALSVLSIIAFHVTVGIIQVYGFEKARDYILNMPQILQPLWHCEKGVDAFFLISAVVLGIPIFRKLDSFNFESTMAFYKKRLFRIYPLFLAALLLYAVPQWGYFGEYFFTNLLLINNLIPGHRTIIPVGWSLLVEVQYYAVLPAVILFLRYTKYQMQALVGLILLSIAAIALRLWEHPELYIRPLTDVFLAPDHDAFTSKFGEYIYESNLTRFGPFAVGLLLAWLRVFKSDQLKNLIHKKTNEYLHLTVAAILFAIGTTIPVYHPTSWFYAYGSPALTFLTLTLVRQLFAVSLAIIILVCWYGNHAGSVALNRIFDLHIWQPISKLSFPIYLFHFPFVAVAAVIVFGTTNIKEVLHVSFIQGAAIFMLATALTILFSIPLYLFIERPMIDRGKKA